MSNLNNCNFSPNSLTSTTPKRRPPLALLKRGTSIAPSPELNSASSSRENAFSFHQNPRTCILFAKNNISVYFGGREQQGYLTLQQDINGILTLKWAPNALLHSDTNQHNSFTSKASFELTSHTHQTPFSIRMETITHIHLHQKIIFPPKFSEEESISFYVVVLVDSDGVEQISFRFGHKRQCLTFLFAVENGLAPLFRIQPPLETIKGIQDESSTNIKNTTEDKSNCKETSVGLIFSIVSFASTIGPAIVVPSFNLTKAPFKMTSERSTSRENSKDDDGQAVRSSLVNATKAMKTQILSRAFNGWLSYCRHMRIISTRLANIVYEIENCGNEEDENGIGGELMPVTETFWKLCRMEKSIPLYKQFLSRVYFCGIENDSLRAQSWPYLLRIVEWHEDLDKNKIDFLKKEYEKDSYEWMEIEKNFLSNSLQKTEYSRQNSEIITTTEFSIQKDYFPSSTRSESTNSDVFEDLDVVDFDENELTNSENDVDRCDRITRFYSKMENLIILRKIMVTYIYRRLKIDINDGYVQGMCDVLAPLLALFVDESLTLACFELEVMDPELYSQLMRNVDYSFVVFYRWLLLDFKRELQYSDVFQLWEVIWSAEVLCSRHFGLFFGLALLTQYREILIENDMDFTDVIKFFNEMAEKHNVQELLIISREKLRSFQEIIRDLNKFNEAV
uniref:Rab-GAP TBC domain-containing protein n=1 Tax=Meloidogyne floridensis TaxID=298350 RepID=A0A915NMZ5_9BILA